MDMMKLSKTTTRRNLLKGGLIMAAGLALPSTGFCRTGHFLSGEKAISLYNLHTGEELQNLVYRADGDYLPDSLQRLNWLLRDYRSDEVQRIDPSLFDLVHAIHGRLSSSGSVQIISGYRSPATNEMLRRQSSGVARHSLHMKGMALDIRVTDCDLAQLKKAAKSLRAGGVGYYPKSQFVHIDTGPVRYW
jgi:uncharacterized protein YcbK (DUF882 family)